MFGKNPTKRLNGHSLLKHKFIKKYEHSLDSTLKNEIDFVKKLKLHKSLNRLKKNQNGFDIWFKKPRYYKPKPINHMEFYEVDKENTNKWSFTISAKTPNLTKRLSKTAIESSGLKKNSAENYTPTSMKNTSLKNTQPLVKPNLSTNLTSQDTYETNDESMETTESQEVNVKEGNIHVYNDILLPVFSDIIKRSVHAETQNDVVELLKKFHDTERSQPGFSNVFVEEISYKLNELKLEI